MVSGRGSSEAPFHVCVNVETVCVDVCHNGGEF